MMTLQPELLPHQRYNTPDEQHPGSCCSQTAEPFLLRERRVFPRQINSTDSEAELQHNPAGPHPDGSLNYDEDGNASSAVLMDRFFFFWQWWRLIKGLLLCLFFKCVLIVRSSVDHFASSSSLGETEGTTSVNETVSRCLFTCRLVESSGRGSQNAEGLLLDESVFIHVFFKSGCLWGPPLTRQKQGLNPLLQCLWLKVADCKNTAKKTTD